ncbi:SGNH/GDSL hydrolase family protein [Geodermatophilus sp. SYSU D00742]
MPHSRRTASLPVFVMALTVLSGCGGPAITGDEATRAGVSAAAAGGPAVVQAGVRSMVAVGDSLTAGGEPIRGPEVDGELSWIRAAVGPQLEFRGGWATGGATTADMRAAATPMDADVLVLMGGTNDLVLGRPWERTREDLLAVADVVGIGAVLLSAVPPHDDLPESATELNRQLQVLADEQGWQFVDPWADARQDGAYVPGASLDGVHPTQRVADEAGLLIRKALLDGAGSPPQQPR